MDRKKLNIWWGPPKDFSKRNEERKISWLELFYDLVYIAAISQITHHLAEDPTWSQYLFSFFIFMLIFWSWMNGSIYRDLHGSSGIRTRLLTLWQMLAATALAISVSEVYEGHHQAFAISFLVIQTLITYNWWSTGYYDPSHKILNRFFIIHYSIGILLLFVSIFLEYDQAIILWIITLIIDVTPSITGARSNIREFKKRNEAYTLTPTMIERFGLFAIIVLGETIFGIVNGVSEVEHKTSVVWWGFIFGIIIAFLLWWIYFDMTGIENLYQRDALGGN